jgi:hypothetical protein
LGIEVEKLELWERKSKSPHVTLRVGHPVWELVWLRNMAVGGSDVYHCWIGGKEAKETKQAKEAAW